MSDLDSTVSFLREQLEEMLPLVNLTKSKLLQEISNSPFNYQEAEDLIKRSKRAIEIDKPEIRIIHHMACSGGTLISKCLASLPNVFVLSELHPTTTLHQGGGKPKFLPADITTQARYAKVPAADDLALSLFKMNIESAYEHIENYGGILIIRDHSHSDFCVGEGFKESSVIANLLKNDFKLLRLVTLRDPIDSYLSLCKNNWVHFSPKTFDEYCKRLWHFLEEYKYTEVVRYEDFVSRPEETMACMADILKIRYDSHFIDLFPIFRVTGDSGRSGATISERARRELTFEETEEIKTSKYYKLIAKKFNYNSLERVP
ncbi:MAG: hypothetical protein CL587_11995 [Alteromonadaceae bacterium]|nr:hypothetical protein [Alteromonadaceae bacterium]